MLFFYPLFTTIASLILLPLRIAGRHKDRHRLLRRLGRGLADRMARIRSSRGAPTFWIHALSVGEVTSALPLVQGLRCAYPSACIVFSATTRSGAETARTLLASSADLVIDGPLDLGPVVPFFIRTIRPDLFILVETDFWPHWLACLARHRIPTFLVNGRISARSFDRYRRFALIFRPMFNGFSRLAMQTRADADKMVALGIKPAKVVTLGNLKFDTGGLAEKDRSPATVARQKERYGFAASAPLWICGSTHHGEEAALFRVYLRLRRDLADLQMLLAPRNIERGEEIAAIAHRMDLDCRRWSLDRSSRSPVLLLDTLGELAGCYTMAHTVFIGGSLVAEGGHNPIEPAVAAVPVFFGPHMEDFAEIAAELVGCGGAGQVAGENELHDRLHRIFTDAPLHRSMAHAAKACVDGQRGVIDRHLAEIGSLVAGTSRV